MRTIDFARARIVWTTHGGSRGIWRVVATARREGRVPQEWFLATGVMAGDVYGRGRLPLTPPYTFQFVTSHDRHVMFRGSLEAAGLRDTDAAHSESFKDITIDAPAIEAPAIPFGSVAAGSQWPLTAWLSGRGADGARWMLEFPIEHINLRDQPPAYQVETGPVVIPCALRDIDGAAKPGDLQLAFIFFNRADRADLLALGPLADPAVGHRGFAHFARLEGVEIGLCGR